MLLGLITDIHEQTDRLQIALDRLAAEAVDQIVLIGDIADDGQRLTATCQMLKDANVIGVWGNHDFGLCQPPDAETREIFGDDALTYMATLTPRLVIDDCLFTHVEPWLNTEDWADLWYFDGLPDDDRKVKRIFGASDHRWMFAGHFHQWLMVTPEGITKWNGREPIHLDQTRYYIVIAAVCDGSYAIFDTETAVLTPFNDA